MFIIKNISDHDVVLDDLRLVLGPGREIDLDKVAPRSMTDYSSKLRMAVHQQRIRIMTKDPDRFVQHGSVNVVQPVVDNSALHAMETRLKTEINSRDKQIESLTSALASLVEQLKNAPAPVVNVVNHGVTSESTKEAEKDSSPADISDDIASSIHAKAMTRLGKNSTGTIEQQSVKQTDKSLNNNISELENLGL